MFTTSHFSRPINAIETPISIHEHIQTNLGINLSMLKDADEWDTSRIYSHMPRFNSLTPTERMCTAIYDGFVGQTETAKLDQSLKYRDLKKINHYFAQVLPHAKAYPDDSGRAVKVDLARSVIELTGQLMELLKPTSDEAPVEIKKNLSIGVRHTLRAIQTEDMRRGANHSERRVVEHLNSLTEFEAERFLAKHPTFEGKLAHSYHQSERPGDPDVQQKIKFKIGDGGFGVVRVARLVKQDEYLAFKKTRLGRVANNPQQEAAFAKENIQRLKNLAAIQPSTNSVADIGGNDAHQLESQRLGDNIAIPLDTFVYQGRAGSRRPGSTNQILVLLSHVESQ